jgi:predicted tellurium resistance membrane protein TerC
MNMSFEYQCILIVFGAALLLLGLAMLWNIYRPEQGWKRELHETRQANRERQPLVERLEQVAR